METYFYVYLIYLTTVFIAVAIGGFRFKKHNFEMRMLFWLFVVAAIEEVVMLVLARTGHHNSWTSLIYKAIEYSMLGLIFSRWIENPIARNTLIISIPLFIITEIIGLFVASNMANLTFFILSLATVFYALYSSYTLIQLQLNDYGNLFMDHRFWVTAALLFYSAGTIVFYVITMFVVSNVVYYLFLAVNGISYGIYSKAFLCDIPQKT